MPPIKSQIPEKLSSALDVDPREERERGSFWTFDLMEERMVEAMTVLMRSSDRERSWLRGKASSLWSQVQADLAEASPDDRAIVTCAMTREQERLADEALGWVVRSVASGDTRRILGLGLMQLARGDRARIDWAWLRSRLSNADEWTTDQLRMRYSRAITVLCNDRNARTLAG